MTVPQPKGVHTPVLCLACRRLTRPGVVGTCQAFPDGIPIEIGLSGGDHRRPVEGDHGLQFVQAAGAEAAQAFADWVDTYIDRVP